MSQDAPRILVIEDEQPIRRFLGISLESQNFHVTEVTTAAKGLQSVLAEPPRRDLARPRPAGRRRPRSPSARSASGRASR